jgi:predicted acylesterase/phospholipase RssA
VDARHKAGHDGHGGLTMFDAIVFAGGGNRCYWQGGFYEALAERFALKPALAVGVSAGAFAGIYSLLGIGPKVRAQVLPACGPHRRNFDFAAWRRGEALCPVGPMYRAFLDMLFDATALARLQQLTDFHIAISRLPRGLPPILGAALGIAAYQVEKHLLAPVHPRFGRSLGFTAEFIRVRAMTAPRELADALMASGGVPPFMPVTNVDGRPAFDGGLFDGVPVAPLDAVEAKGGRSLVLLTRLYKNIPQMPGRTYVQPSRRIRVKQFDLTDPDGIRDAYELGLKDGARFAAANH